MTWYLGIRGTAQLSFPSLRPPRRHAVLSERGSTARVQGFSRFRRWKPSPAYVPVPALGVDGSAAYCFIHGCADETWLLLASVAALSLRFSHSPPERRRRPCGQKTSRRGVHAAHSSVATAYASGLLA